MRTKNKIRGGYKMYFHKGRRLKRSTLVTPIESRYRVYSSFRELSPDIYNTKKFNRLAMRIVGGIYPEQQNVLETMKNHLECISNMYLSIHKLPYCLNSYLKFFEELEMLLNDEYAEELHGEKPFTVRPFNEDLEFVMTRGGARIKLSLIRPATSRTTLETKLAQLYYHLGRLSSRSSDLVKRCICLDIARLKTWYCSMESNGITAHEALTKFVNLCNTRSTSERLKLVHRRVDGQSGESYVLVSPQKIPIGIYIDANDVITCEIK